MKTLIFLLSFASIGSAQAQMTVTRAMESLNGRYQIIEKSSDRFCQKTIEIDVIYDAGNRSLELRRLDLDRWIETPDKVNFGTQNHGREAFIELKERYSIPNDGYSGALMNEVRSSVKLSLPEGGEILKVDTSESFWKLMSSDCTSSKLFTKGRSQMSCVYRKL